MGDITESELDQVVRAYWLRRRMIHPDTKKPNIVKKRELWLRVARAIRSCGASIEGYMDAQFAKQLCPMPEHLHGQAARTAYAAHQQSIGVTVKSEEFECGIKLRDDIECFDSRREVHGAVNWLLNTVSNTMTPIFRFCMLMKLGHREEAAEFEMAAKQQLRGSPAWRKVAQPILPHGWNWEVD